MKAILFFVALAARGSLALEEKPSVPFLSRILSKTNISYSPPISIPAQGVVSGFKWTSFNRKDFDAYLAIPYAAPPTGELRFARPKPPLEWTGVRRIAFETCITCTQMNLLEEVKGNEDCLVLNVYTPRKGNCRKRRNSPLPVMVFIHGGAFFAGCSSPDSYGPHFFMNHEVVLVTINYRLGQLGFWTLENDSSPGNLGLRDMIMALEWVQRNIALFGGDAHQVTIFGESAGSMAVQFLMVSPMAKGLMHRVIAQSGPMVSSFTDFDKSPRSYGLRHAETLNCSTSQSVEAIVDCMRKLPVSVFPNRLRDFDHFPWTGPWPWKPYIDGGAVSDPVLPDDPLRLIERGEYNRVPLIIGSNGDEGAFNVLPYVKGRSNLGEVDRMWDLLGPLILFHRSLDEVTAEDVRLARFVRRFYFPPPTKIGMDSLKEVIKMIGDSTFYGGNELIIQTILDDAKAAPVYQYMYSHVGSYTTVDYFLLKQWQKYIKLATKYFGFDIFNHQLGVSHADELLLMWSNINLPYQGNCSNEDKSTSDLILNYWTNFARSGDPNDVGLPHWCRANRFRRRYLNITNNGAVMDFNEDWAIRMTGWAQIIQRERRLRPRYSQKPPLMASEISVPEMFERVMQLF